MENYDSTADTLLHIKRVSYHLSQAAIEILRRGSVHDDSKLTTPEKEAFDKETPKLKGIGFGTKEYYESLANLQEALDHHYKFNSHHPQHYPNGINGMDLFDVLEMTMDWLAAVERTKDGDIAKSLEINKRRFNMSDQLVDIIANTYRNYGHQGN